MAVLNRRVPTPVEETQDWREAWGSEADITTGAPQRAAPPAGIFTPTPDVIASALDEFLTEGPSPSAPPPPPAWFPLPVAARQGAVSTRHHPRALVLAAAAAAVLLAAVAIGFRGSPMPAVADATLVTPVALAPPESVAEPEARRAAARSPQERAAESEPPATLAARRTPPAVNAAPPTVRSPIAGRGGTPSNDRAVPRSSRPALDTSTRAPVVSVPPVAASIAGPAPPANLSVSPLPETPPMTASPPATLSPAASPPPAPPTDRQAIHAVLGQYQAAFSRLDANAVRTIWPGLNAAALERAFGQVERQAVTFSACSVAIIGAGATARCQGSASYVPKVGTRTERVDHRRWQIDLRKSGDDWRIVAVDARE